jgi:hypothetical protein
MKIRKTDIPECETIEKIESALEEYKKDEEYRNNVGNRHHTEHPKIRELHLNGGVFEFIDKTLEEEKAADKLEAEKKVEQDKKDRIILAKTDPIVRDSLITELMTSAGFSETKTALAYVQKMEDGKDMSQYFSDRALKLSEIKTMIAEAQKETI